LSLWNNRIHDTSPLSNLVNLTFLGLIRNEITDVSPLSNLVNLTQLWLSGNKITDVSPVSKLINLRSLDLTGNQISDLSPLVQNRGLGKEDSIWVAENPLDEDSLNIYIPQLERRGVRIECR